MGKITYTDQMLAECLVRARGRVKRLEQLDAALGKPASWRACAAKS